ncbi:MAG: maltose alpha-D-glucosyltransferase [Acidimicrobiales bacterium]
MTAVVDAKGPTPVALTTAGPGTDCWYKDAIIYEVHIRAFCDSNGDGIGDLPGLTEKLDYLQGLGVTALWLLPFYSSPLRDDGYDISDYRHIHPAYGTLRDFRNLLREAHRRGLKVITELVLNHTSDEHPWFQRARTSRPGTSQRDFYVWSETADRYSDARVIFKDFETSNWTWDPVAEAYFWHRFYSHQPSLNYDSPAVRKAMLEVVDFWLTMGVDGLRLDAVPYLYAREGTTCENLPETFEFLRLLRRHVDERFEGRMLLAEANQWPEDAVAYMGNDDMCQMAFHFPLMPRMFMAARQEDRFPIVDILGETPAAPPNGQWALFLRNHDELTLEMVTDEERDYMYRAYAQDPQARVNVGIRRRLAPLLGNDRNLIEMMNGLLFSLPGTPIIYYGDEIGMGDNIYLGDRNAVRTPMQWNSDRNAGFSRANPQSLYLPVIIDNEFHSQAVNVEAQDSNPSSLLWWMRRLTSLRTRYRAFGRGTLEVLRPDNRKVLAFLRRYEDELILVVVNLSRMVQCVELDLSEFRGATPVELFGTTSLPQVGDLPYFLTLGPHGFYWLSLERETARAPVPRLSLRAGRSWETLLSGSQARRLEPVLTMYIRDRRWFVSKARTIAELSVADVILVPTNGHRSGPECRPECAIAIVNVEFDHGAAEQYVLPVAFAVGEQAEDLTRWHCEAIIADVHTTAGDGVLFDATYEPEFSRSIIDVIARRRRLAGRHGRVTGSPSPMLRSIRAGIESDVQPVPISAEQSNTSVVFGDAAVLKFVRRLEPGINPGVEISRFLGERAGFAYAPPTGGSLDYQGPGGIAQTATLASIEKYVPNEGDGWNYVVDALGHQLEEALARAGAENPGAGSPAHVLGLTSGDVASGHVLLGPHIEWPSLLGRRTGELHVALSSDRTDPDFAPERLTQVDRQSLFQSARSMTRRVLRQVAHAANNSAGVAEVLDRESEIIDRLRAMNRGPMHAERIRCHGDFHLGQVLWTGKDFVIIDFEGEPSRSLTHRRLKRPATFDLAGMIRSFHYASRSAAVRMNLDSAGDDGLEPWLIMWYRFVSETFLRSYMEVAGQGGFLPEDDGQLSGMLDFFLLEKSVYELGYEVNSRPELVDIPARGILDILNAGP